MTKPDQDREELLRAAALGQLDHGAPAVAARLAEDVELARAVGELERARATAERVIQEGARLTEEAVRTASPSDREHVLATIESLARGDRAGHHRGRFFLVAGLAAAAIVIVLALRLWPGAEARDDVLLGTPDVNLEVLEIDGSFDGLRWNVSLRAGDELSLTFYTLRGDERGERILGPLRVASEGWRPTQEQGQGLPRSWVVELERVNGDDSSLLAREKHFSRR